MSATAKPAYTHSIVQVNAGATMPETLLHKLCTEFGSFIGLVVREPTHLEIERFLELGDAESRIKMLTDVNNGSVKYPRQFTFGQCPPEFDEDECQPWVPIRDSKGKPLLTISIEGDFPGRTSAEGFSEAFVLLQEYLGPKIEEVYKLSGNNPQKLLDYIAGESFKNDVANTVGFRHAIFCMPTVGPPIILGNFREEGKGGADYAWGSCSFNFGYTDPVIEAATPAKEATMPKNPPKVSKYGADAPVEPKPATPVPSVPTVIPATPANPVEKVATEIVSDDAVLWAPPVGLHGKGLKKAYRDMLGGVLPENWQQRPSFMIKAKADTEVVKAAGAAPVKAKDMQSDAPPKVVLPVIDGNQQAKAVDFIKKHLGDGSLEIGDPLAAQKQESNLAVFSEICLKSNDLDELERWPVSGIFAFVKANPEAAALAFIQYRRDRINRKASMKDAGKTMGELTGTGIEVAPATPTAPVLVPSTPSPEPAKIEPPAIPAARRAGSKYT